MIIPQLHGLYTILYFTDLIRSIFVTAPKRFIVQCWWKYMPGVEIVVKWPRSPIAVNSSNPNWFDCGGAEWVLIDSADPNDHYRPWLEEKVGRQGWDWNWDCVISDNHDDDHLTIKFKKGKEKYATLAAIKWSK